jgi:putative colanic acid biosynthesis acetyltransferase WcaF
MNKVDNSMFENRWYSSGRNILVVTIWYFVSVIIFQSYFFPFYRLKAIILRLFGASIGKNLVIKPCVLIKYPWNLSIGNNVWIGEKVWIDNLAKVSIGDNCCISQGAYLMTGNHNYKSTKFDLTIGEIYLEEGVWIGAKSIICLNVRCKSHSILSLASVAVNDLEAYEIYKGNPAIKTRTRNII